MSFQNKFSDQFRYAHIKGRKEDFHTDYRNSFSSFSSYQS